MKKLMFALILCAGFATSAHGLNNRQQDVYALNLALIPGVGAATGFILNTLCPDAYRAHANIFTAATAGCGFLAFKNATDKATLQYSGLIESAAVPGAAAGYLAGSLAGTGVHKAIAWTCKKVSAKTRAAYQWLRTKRS